ncbi:hypothetical protein HGRIS_007912 [Hohenbuehelia grisea]|uniref:Peroxin domain-containing protein n=1 Tax=Hohenbuehelia grisea TaxID=104357 RepID=A0ABR3J6A6_9AGAR
MTTTYPPPSPFQLQKRDSNDTEFKPAHDRVDPAKRRRTFSLFASGRRHRERRLRRQSTEEEDGVLHIQQTADVYSSIEVEAPEELEEDSKAEYRWAVVYENQRGYALPVLPQAQEVTDSANRLMFFSVPYYSSFSLLPRDPLPFSMPNAEKPRRKQTKFTLADYPLPDSRWRWVSHSWMVDMRSNTGEVQQDGFEYNWLFRQHKWHARPGKFGKGSWVRRRRWLRLMVRPKAEDSSEQSCRPLEGAQSLWLSISTYSQSENQSDNRTSIAQSSLSPSSSSSLTSNPFKVDPHDLWQGTISEDAERCFMLLKHFDRDGRKLELWQWWLGLERQPRVGKRTRMDTSSSFGDISLHIPLSDPPIDHIAMFLRQHCPQVLRLFVYPESRAKFIIMLRDAGILPRLSLAYDLGWIVEELGFWSYQEDLGPEHLRESIDHRQNTKHQIERK